MKRAQRDTVELPADWSWQDAYVSKNAQDYLNTILQDNAKLWAQMYLADVNRELMSFRSLKGTK